MRFFGEGEGERYIIVDIIVDINEDETPHAM